MGALQRQITSREYKLMLNVDRFHNRERDAVDFWHLLEFLLTKQGGEVVKEQHSEEERLTWYLDTPEFALRQRGFVLRVREESKDGDKRYKTTLKYRSGDRYLAAAQNVASSEEGKFKFEEDILPPFQSKFSHSNSVKSKKVPKLTKMGKVIDLFPGLETLKIDKDTSIKKVNKFTAHETFRKVAQVKFSQEPVVKLGLSFWYLLGKKGELPLVAEFSFDYDDESKSEQFPLEVIMGSKSFFHSLQKQSGWLNFQGTTKTAFAYGGF